MSRLVQLYTEDGRVVLARGARPSPVPFFVPTPRYPVFITNYPTPNYYYYLPAPIYVRAPIPVRLSYYSPTPSWTGLMVQAGQSSQDRLLSQYNIRF